jgi:uncharacterized protein (TIGR00730 family)
MATLDFRNQDPWRMFRIMAEFVEGFEEMSTVGRAVSIFGSARTKPDHPDYIAAEKTARLLVKAKLAVITGGGPGIMEAGNKGAYEAGGKSIGLNITLPHEQEGNKYQTKSLDFHYFYVRKVMFTKYASGFICFPGGFGTLDEFYENLTLIQTLKVDSFPVVLYGRKYWTGLIDWMREALSGEFIDREDLDIFRLVDTPEEAVKETLAGIKKHWWMPRDQELKKLVMAGARGRKFPIEQEPGSVPTGEGTMYGRRPTKTQKKHAKASKKPQQ